MGTKFGGRLSEHAFEAAIELGERLEADIVCDFADAAARIEKLCPRFLQTDPRDVVGEFQAGGLVEYFAEMEHAGTGCAGAAQQTTSLFEA